MCERKKVFGRSAALKTRQHERGLRKSVILLEFPKLTEFLTFITSCLRVRKQICAENLDASRIHESKIAEPRMMTLTLVSPKIYMWYA